MSHLEQRFDIWEQDLSNKDMSRAFDRACTRQNVIEILRELKGLRACNDTISELEHLHRQDQAKITELQLQLEKEKEATRNALADRAQVSKQLTKVREANEQLAEQCKENDALKDKNQKLLAICDDIDTAGDMFKPEINVYFRYVNDKCKEAQGLRDESLDEDV